MFNQPLNRLTALISSAAIVSLLALPAPAMAKNNDTLRKLLVLGAAALVVKALVDNQRRVNSASAPVYTSPGLSNTEIADVQYDLRRAGFYSGRIDGIWGSQTRQAVLNWQRAYGYSSTGVLTKAQISLLDRSTVNIASGTYSTSGSTVAPTPLPPANYYGSTTLDSNQFSGLQADLKFLGYYPGAVDGIWGQRSQAALEQFRLDHDSNANFNLRAQPGTLDLASAAISARELEDDIAAELEQRLALSGT